MLRIGQHDAVKRGAISCLALLAVLVVACSDNKAQSGSPSAVASSTAPISGQVDLPLPSALPAFGIALGRAGAAVFFTNDGQELFRLPGYSVPGDQPPMVTDRDGHRFLIRGGSRVLLATEIEPRPPTDYVAGQRCALLDQRDETRLLSCWQPRLTATTQETPPTLFD